MLYGNFIQFLVRPRLLPSNASLYTTDADTHILTQRELDEHIRTMRRPPDQAASVLDSAGSVNVD